MARTELHKELMSSVISIVPFPLHEEKPGLYPGVFDIPASENNEPRILNVGESIHYVEVDVGRSISVSNPSYKVAQSIVEDYVVSELGFDITKEAGPGIFWKPGFYDLARVYADCKPELELSIERQRNWFTELVRIADDDWEKTRQHRSITNQQRFAAKYLQLDRPWIVAIKDAKPVTCPACTTIVSPESIICPACRCILDYEKYKTLQFASPVGV